MFVANAERRESSSGAGIAVTTKNYSAWHVRSLLKKKAFHTELREADLPNIGDMVAAIPTIENDAYWGYCAVPPDRCEWWYAVQEAPLT